LEKGRVKERLVFLWQRREGEVRAKECEGNGEY